MTATRSAHACSLPSDVIAVDRSQVSRAEAESRFFRSGPFPLARGGMLPELVIAYVTYGRLAPDGRNGALLTHGYSSNHLYASGPRPGASEGAWSTLVGPGQAIDTEQLFVVSSNMLGSCYGSTGPASVDPRTGRPYGPDFPEITVADMVRAQRLLLDHLGVNRLRVVAGPSYGGMQAFQWAVDYPELVEAIVPVMSSPGGPVGMPDGEGFRRRLAAHPVWNGGDYYADRPALDDLMTEFRVEALRRYGVLAELARSGHDQADADAILLSRSRRWALKFDPNALLVLADAAARYDVRQYLNRITARVLYVLSSSDQIFPPSLAAPGMSLLQQAGIEARYFEIRSDLGHVASSGDAALWEPVLRAFLVDGGASRPSR